MTPAELKGRTKAFAVAIVRFTQRLPRTTEAQVIGRQLFRSGTAVGANYRAVCRPRSDADFIAKLGIVIEEADETAFWLELLVEGGLVAPNATAVVHAEAEELTRIFVAGRETARRNAKRRRLQSRINNQ